jgi:hypothetical protein
MAPSSKQEVASDDTKRKFCEILKKNGISDEVEEVLVHEPEHLKGEHLATASLYVEIKFKDSSIKPKHLFAKKFFDNPLQTAMVKEMKIMDKESSFYQEFLPYAREYCKKYPGYCETIFRKYYIL